MESPTSGGAAVGYGTPAAAPYHPPAAAPAYHAPAPAYHAPVAPPVAAGPSRQDWTAACNRIVDNIVKNLGPVDAPIFYEPVDGKAVRVRRRSPCCLGEPAAAPQGPCLRLAPIRFAWAAAAP
jgi:hypothetical protein